MRRYSTYCPKKTLYNPNQNMLVTERVNDMARYVFLWFPMLAIAVVNGLIRDLTYQRFIGELAGHQVSTAIGIILFGIYIRFVIRRWPPSSIPAAAGVGVLWLVLTLAFEFLFFHYVAGHSWQRLCEAYHIHEGRVWILLLLWILIAPVIFSLPRRTHT